MTNVLLLIHLFVTIALIIVVLLQKSEGGGLGIGGGGGMGNFMSGRGTANLLTRATAILATIFMALALVLALIQQSGRGQRSIVDGVLPASPSAPAVPAAPAAPAGPAVPTN